MLDNLFSTNSIIGASMQVASLRNEVITNNIANVDVPNFKKSVVKFEDMLNKELENSKITGNINLNNLHPYISVTKNNLSTRLDGNNVDIETEMVDLYNNASKYEVMSNSIVANYKRISSVLV